jgi:kynurenine formamidase
MGKIACGAFAYNALSAKEGRMASLIDLSHTVFDGLVTYKGLPAPVICDYLSREASRKNYEGGTQFQIGRIDMVSNTGTYVDCPFHRYADGKDLSAIALERFVDIPAVVVRVDHRKRLEVGTEDFRNVDVAGKAVLVQTGWSAHWNTGAYFENHPFINAAAALRTCANGARYWWASTRTTSTIRARATAGRCTPSCCERKSSSSSICAGSSSCRTTLSRSAPCRRR